MLLFIFSILLIIFLIINSCFVSSKNIELYTQYFNDIPKVVYQTYKSYNDIPECVKKVMQHNISLNPEYEFKFFDDNAVETYIKKHTDQHICVQALHVPQAPDLDLRPGAHRHEASGGLQHESGCAKRGSGTRREIHRLQHLHLP